MATIIDKYRLTPTLHLGVRWRKAGKEGVRNLRKKSLLTRSKCAAIKHKDQVYLLKRARSFIFLV